MTKWDHLLESDAAVAAALRKLRVSPLDVDLWDSALVQTKRSGLLLVIWVPTGRLWLPRTVTDARIAGPGKTMSAPGQLEINTDQFHGWGPFTQIVGPSTNKAFRIGTVRRVGSNYELVDDAGLGTTTTTIGRKRVLGMSPKNMVWAGRYGKKKASDD